MGKRTERGPVALIRPAERSERTHRETRPGFLCAPRSLPGRVTWAARRASSGARGASATRRAPAGRQGPITQGHLMGAAGEDRPMLKPADYRRWFAPSSGVTSSRACRLELPARRPPCAVARSSLQPLIRRFGALASIETSQRMLRCSECAIRLA